MVSEKYFVALVGPDDIRRSDELPWEEVSKQTYVRHERNAGFRNTMGQRDEPATSAFSSSRYPYHGKIQYGSAPVRTESQATTGELDLF